jgi:hypothetical protein
MLPITTWEQVGARTGGLWVIAGDIASWHSNRRDAIEFFAKGIDELHWFGYRPVLGSALLRLGNQLADDDPEAAEVLYSASHVSRPAMSWRPMSPKSVNTPPRRSRLPSPKLVVPS